MKNITNLGNIESIVSLANDLISQGFEIGRVIQEHKERYIVRTNSGEYDAEITGNLRFTANSREDYPAVGDWVSVLIYDELAIIHQVLPRYSAISRSAVSKFAEKQIIAANIDYALIVQAVDRDYNINRIERYLAICFSSNVKPIIVLNKIDLITKDELEHLVSDINKRLKNIPIISISNISRFGYDDLNNIIESGMTYCLLGSSGVGKSSLINNLSEKDIMKTDSISKSNNKGRHITSHRELVILPSGGIFIDNPGMREVGIADSSAGLERVYDSIYEYASKCRFSDCTHSNEIGCAVLEAVNNGDIDLNAYKNFLKMEKERLHFELSEIEKRKKDKEFGKIIKEYKKLNVKRK